MVAEFRRLFKRRPAGGMPATGFQKRFMFVWAVGNGQGRSWHETAVPPAHDDFRFRGHNGHQNRGCRLPLLTHNGLQRVLDHPRLHRPLPLEVARGGAGAFGIRQDAEPTVASGQQKFEIIDWFRFADYMSRCLCPLGFVSSLGFGYAPAPCLRTGRGICFEGQVNTGHKRPQRHKTNSKTPR